MQLRTFSSFIKNVVSEGNRLQKVDITGEVTTKNKYTQTQLIAIAFSIVLLFLLKTGFSGDFAGYVISFLSIFIGLFSSIVISLFDKSHNLKEKILSEKSKAQNNTANPTEIERLKKIRNYLVQFTGLTSYAIYLAICIIVLLICILVHSFFELDLYKFSFVKTIADINRHTIFNFIQVLILVLHRVLISYLLINFFSITLYAVTSYFSYISSEYKNQILNND